MKDEENLKAMLTGYKIEVKNEEFFYYMRIIYNADYNIFRDGDTMYVTQEIYDRLKEI